MQDNIRTDVHYFCHSNANGWLNQKWCFDHFADTWITGAKKEGKTSFLGTGCDCIRSRVHFKALDTITMHYNTKRKTAWLHSSSGVCLQSTALEERTPTMGTSPPHWWDTINVLVVIILKIITDNLLICFKKKIAPRQNFNIDVCELLPVYILLERGGRNYGQFKIAVNLSIKSGLHSLQGYVDFSDPL